MDLQHPDLAMQYAQQRGRLAAGGERAWPPGQPGPRRQHSRRQRRRL